jgi:superfamily II DNA or RNA helicase
MTLPPWTTELRPWQRLDGDRIIDGDRQDWTQYACPGAGKTIFAGYVAHSLLTKQRIRQLVIVVPTDNLREQWVAKLAQHGIQIDPAVRGDRPDPNERAFHGVVTTYQTLSQNGAAANFATRAAQRPTMLIADECHHAIEASSWGEALGEVGAAAEFRLLLTGTPFHTDKTARLKLARFDEDNRIICDGSYTLAQAINDGVCRRLQFITYDGQVEVLDRRENQLREMRLAVDLDGRDLSQTEQGAALRTALTAGSFLPGMLANAATMLDNMRETDPRAAALVVAMDTSEADRIARLLRVSGREVVVVHEREDNVRAKIMGFATGTAPWLVAVGMVSEGTDIPRLALLTYATNKATGMLFRQLCGRVLRTSSTDRTELAICMMPNNPTLVRLGMELMNEQPEPVEMPPPSPEDPSPGGGDSVPRFQGLDSESPTLDGSFATDGTYADAKTYFSGESFCATAGIPAQFAMAVGLELERMGLIAQVATEPTFAASSTGEVDSLAQRRRNAKAEVKSLSNKLVSAIIRRRGLDYRADFGSISKEVATDIATAVGAYRSNSTLEHLERAIPYLKARLVDEH